VETEASETVGAGTMLAEADALRSRTRRARRSTWFPLVLFGTLTVLSAAFCSNDPISAGDSRYWLLAGPLGYLAVYGFSRWRETHKGVGWDAGPYIATGLVMAVRSTGFAWLFLGGTGPVTIAALAVAVVAGMMRRPLVAAAALAIVIIAVVNSFVPILFLGSVLEQNTAPVIGTAVALLVLATYERSIYVAAVAVVAGVLAGLSGLFIIDNLFDALPHCGADLSAIGGFMIVAGGVGVGIDRWLASR
jgi:hypothetical protein